MGASGSFFKVLLFLLVLVSWNKGFSNQTFVENCLENTEVLTKPLICETPELTFTLHQGMSISVVSKKVRIQHLPVRKITHLPARIESVGVVGESVKFVAYNNGVVATVNVLCGQDKYGFVGLSGNAQILPSETVAPCHY